LIDYPLVLVCKIPPNAEQRVEEHDSVIAGTVRSHVFACPDNMFLSGNKDITCNVNGEWTVSKATCKGLSIHGILIKNLKAIKLFLLSNYDIKAFKTYIMNDIKVNITDTIGVIKI
jgi:hypothetical protein